MEKKMKLLPPMMPNFIRLERKSGIAEISISVSELSDEEAKEYAEFMKQEFIKHHKELKNNN